MRADPTNRVKLKELRKCLPASRNDLSAVAVLARMGAAVQPLVPDLLKWTRDESWPVAKPVTDLLVGLGSAIVGELNGALGSRDSTLRIAALRIASKLPANGLRQLSSRLFMIATDGQSWGADLLALQLLARHEIADDAWIEAWLDFKREYHDARLADIAGIRRLLETRSHGT